VTSTTRALQTSAIALVSLTVVAACWRYRAVSAKCPSEPAPSTAFEASVIRTSGNEVHGRVVTHLSSEPLANASVDFPTIPDSRVLTTADGEFSLRADSLGIYSLRVRHIGYQQALGRVRVRADSGQPLLVVIDETTVTLDGCGYVQYRERRPWWQWWLPPNDH
jgi:hypothetical protein